MNDGWYNSYSPERHKSGKLKIFINLVKQKGESGMSVRKFAVQYRFNGVWFDFAKYNAESDAREKAKKLLAFGAARVIPVWCN